MSDFFWNYQNPNQSFTFSYRNTTGHFNMQANHFHDGFEVFYMLSGERYYFLKERTFYIQKGDLILTSPYDLHKTTDTGVPNYERILFKFNREFITTTDLSYDEELLNPLFEVPVVRFSAPAQTYAEEMLQKMYQEAKLKKTGFEPLVKGYLLEFLVFSRRYIETHPIEHLDHPSPNHQKVSEIVQYINQHYHEEITLSSISKQFYLSTYYFSRIFKSITGFTFIEYLNSVRIKEAQRLLRESRLNVSGIAEKVGFGSIAHFGRVFKTVTGQSPLHYKKMNRI